jgi:hypothetical protein
MWHALVVTAELARIVQQVDDSGAQKSSEGQYQ